MKYYSSPLLFGFLLLISGFLTSCEGLGQSALQREKSDNNTTQILPTKGDASDQQLAQNIYEIFEDNQGYLWFGTQDKGVAKYDGHTLKFITEDDGLCGKTVANIAQDNDGIIWFGTHSDMCLYDPRGPIDNDEITIGTFEKNGDIPHLGYGWKSVKTDPQGNIWVNSHHGIFSYEKGMFKDFKVPSPYDGDPSFCNTPGGVSFDLTDSQGNMWFGTDKDGAYKYDGIEFTHFSKSDGLSSNSVMGIEEDKNGNIWFVCRESLDSQNDDGGVSMYDGSAFHNFNNIKGLYNNDLNTIYADKSGDIWIGATGVGVYKHDGESFYLYPEPKGVDLSDTFSINGLQSMLEDSRGVYWFGFSGGLFKMENGKLVNVTQGMLGRA